MWQAAEIYDFKRNRRIIKGGFCLDVQSVSSLSERSLNVHLIQAWIQWN